MDANELSLLPGSSEGTEANILTRQRPKRNSPPSKVPSPSCRMLFRSQVSVIIKLTLASLLLHSLIQLVHCSQEVAQNQSISSRSDEKNDDIDEPIGRSGRSNDEYERQELMAAEPRQQFRLHLVSPSKRSSFKFLGNAAHSIHHRQAIDKSTATNQQSATLQPKRQQPGKSKISNAKLKRLLEQSLLRASNGTLMSSAFNSTTKSNFKFVFIQRATAAPSSGSIKSPIVEQVKKNSYIGTKPTKSQPTQPSLATSVSKQLASSLFYSAANLVGNLTSSAPSISSLVAQTLDAPAAVSPPLSISSTSTTTGPPSAMTGGSQSNNENLIDIKRISSASGETKGKQKSGVKKTQGDKTPAKSRPSKIYNLPVKFVANGQPNHVVFSTLKNHFATIKKLQSMSKDPVVGGTKRRRPQNGMAGSKPKGNSRLIYLPLKYLSNARPNKIQLISSKATHKSNN